MTEHPITPPRELVQQWIENTRSNDCIGAYDPEYEQCIALQAARWGSDQELEACCEWLSIASSHGLGWGAATILSGKLRTARRAKPPSLKRRALEALEDHEIEWLKRSSIIRQALEQIDD
jgi:hypothetical protein